MRLGDRSMEHIERCAKEEPDISGEALTWYLLKCYKNALKEGWCRVHLLGATVHALGHPIRHVGHFFLGISDRLLRKRSGNGCHWGEESSEWLQLPEERVEHETEPRTSQAAAGKAEAEIVGAGNEIVGHGSKHVPDQMLQKYSGGRVLSRTQSWSAELARFL
jgi:hypothetical protein